MDTTHPPGQVPLLLGADSIFPIICRSLLVNKRQQPCFDTLLSFVTLTRGWTCDFRSRSACPAGSGLVLYVFMEYFESKKQSEYLMICNEVDK